MVSYYQDKQQQNTLHIQHMSLNKALFKIPMKIKYLFPDYTASFLNITSTTSHWFKGLCIYTTYLMVMGHQ